MTQNPGPQKKKPFPFIPVLGIVFVLGVLFTAGGFVFAANQESHDAFCASCHTQPESTYYQRSTASQAADLASFHNTQNTRCIDCHSGQGISGRVSAELMGARNALLWYTGKTVQPAVLNFPIGDANCFKCHQDVTQQGFTPKEQITIAGIAGRGGGREGEGRANHWHEFLARWQAADPNAGTCVSCHSGHATGATAQSGFMNAQNVQKVCDACHQILRREGG
jgi:nitrate/TMAO reductase-like tetraheme cytochrome c subunit